MFTFAMTVRVGVPLDPGAVRRALSAMRGRYPSLEAADGGPPFPLAVHEGTSSKAWVPVAEAGLAASFPAGAAHVAFTMVRTDATTDLVLIGDHGAADGRTGGYLLQDLVSLLAHPETALPPAPPALTLADVLPEDAEPPAGSADPLPEPPARRYQAVHGSLSRSQSAALLARCRQERTTLQAALCVAWVRALADTGGLVTGAEPPTVSSPVDARRLLPADRRDAVGLLITTLVTPVGLGPDPWEAARAVGQELARGLEPDRLRDRIRRSREEFRRMLTGPDDGTGAPSSADGPRPVDYELSMTNLGRLDLPADGPVPVEACFGMVNVLAGERTVATCTVAGRLHTALTTFRGDHDDAWPATALDHALRNLTDATTR